MTKIFFKIAVTGSRLYPMQEDYPIVSYNEKRRDFFFFFKCKHYSREYSILQIYLKKRRRLHAQFLLTFGKTRIL